MSPAKRKQVDPLEKAIEAALSPGRFISYNAAWSEFEAHPSTFTYKELMRYVPGRKGMSYTEEDWVDEDATSHRGPDD